MTDLEIKLKCTRCRAYRAFDRVGSSVVTCARCGKRHSVDSLYAVEEGEVPTFEDEAGPGSF